MDWSKGITAEYYACFVDPVTWRDGDRIEVTGGTISKVNSGLRESADIDCRQYDSNRERWIRIYFNAKQSGDIEHVALFTGLTTCPSIDIKGVIKKYPLECYSVLKPADDIVLQRGWYAPAGASGGTIIRQLLMVTPAPVVVEDNSPTLTQSIVAEDGETNLTMIDRILDVINWRMYMDGDGTIHVASKNDASVAEFGINYDVMEQDINIEHDWYQCPNVVSVTSNGQTAVVRDDSPDSMLSTVSRGREIWRIESDSELNDGEGLIEYAYRKLHEEQSYLTKLSYDRRFEPNVNVGDRISLHYPEHDPAGDQWLVGTYVIESQDLELGHSVKVSEEVYREN